MMCKGCGSLKIENRTTLECASCGAARRKAERMRAPEPGKPISKVSAKMGANLSKYAAIRKKFLLNKWCAYHGKPCLPTDIHHAKGRVGVADDQNIPLLLDVRYFIPLCREAHRFIEENPLFAKENGYSESRLID